MIIQKIMNQGLKVHAWRIIYIQTIQIKLDKKKIKKLMMIKSLNTMPKI